MTHCLKKASEYKRAPYSSGCQRPCSKVLQAHRNQGARHVSLAHRCAIPSCLCHVNTVMQQFLGWSWRRRLSAQTGLLKRMARSVASLLLFLEESLGIPSPLRPFSSLPQSSPRVSTMTVICGVSSGRASTVEYSARALPLMAWKSSKGLPARISSD